MTSDAPTPDVPWEPPPATLDSLLRFLATLEAWIELPSFHAQFRYHCPMEATEAEVAALLSEAIDRGLVDLDTELAPTPFICLSTLGAERIGMQLDEFSRRWHPIAADHLEPAPQVSQPGFEQLTDYDLDDRPDPRAQEPIDYLVDDESRGFTKRGWPIPRMYHIIGQRIIWKGPPFFLRSERCPGCGGRELSIHTYCLVCDHSGVDHMLPHVEAAPIRRSRARFKPRGKQSVA